MFESFINDSVDPRFDYLIGASDSARTLRMAALKSGYAAAMIRFREGADQERIHDEFAAAFQFPTDYGRNWAALHDCLCDQAWNPGREIVVIIEGTRFLPLDLAKALLLCLGTVEVGWANPFENHGPPRRLRVSLVGPMEEFASVSQLLSEVFPRAHLRQRKIHEGSGGTRGNAKARPIKSTSPFSSEPETLYQCPVCGYPGLVLPVFEQLLHGPFPSFETCPSCGFEFGFDDGVKGRSYADHRDKWVAGGMLWWAARSEPPPRNWDPRAQIGMLDMSVVFEAHIELLRKANDHQRDPDARTVGDDEV
jgi:hypothetical protein